MIQWLSKYDLENFINRVLPVRSVGIQWNLQIGSINVAPTNSEMHYVGVQFIEPD